MLINTVTPKEFPRMPGANTVAYYPLTSDIKDYSGNGHNGTIIGNNGSFQTIGGKQAYKFWYSGGGSSGGMDTRIDTGVQISTLPITLVARYYWPGGNDRETIISNSSGNNNNCYGIRAISSNSQVYIVNATSSDITTGQTLVKNAWGNIIVTIQNGTTKLFLNGVEKYSIASGNSYSTGATFKIGYLGLQDTSTGYYHYGWNGYLADVIIENKVRTVQEVSNYYNQTKSNYGL